jgi:hypothetical protein
MIVNGLNKKKTITVTLKKNLFFKRKKWYSSIFCQLNMEGRNWVRKGQIKWPKSTRVSMTNYNLGNKEQVNSS